MPDADWDDGFALKFFGAMRLCRAAWIHLRQRQGSINNIVGVGGRTGSAEFTIGGSVNGALLNMTKCLSDRGIRDGIRVNAINPGAILTERLQIRVKSYADEKKIEETAAPVQMHRPLAWLALGNRKRSHEWWHFLPPRCQDTAKEASSTWMAV